MHWSKTKYAGELECHTDALTVVLRPSPGGYLVRAFYWSPVAPSRMKDRVLEGGKLEDAQVAGDLLFEEISANPGVVGG